MKLFLLSAAILLLTFNLFGQGVIAFANDNTLAVRNPITGALTTAEDDIRVALYWAPLASPNNFSQLGDSVLVGASPSVPGQFNGGSRTTGPATAPGEAAFFLIRGWETVYGATYEAAQAAPAMDGRTSILCTSPIFFLPTLDPSAPRSLSLSSSAQPPFTGITCVPEPSFIVVWLLALPSLLLVKKLKQRLILA